MKALFVAARIWAMTIFLNACLFGSIQLLMGHWEAIWGSLIILFGGYLTTLPLLLLIVPLVELSRRLPYGNAARMAWLFFYLVLLILLFYLVFEQLTGSYWGMGQAVPLLTGTTIAGLFMSVWFFPNSLANLYTGNSKNTVNT